MTIDQLLLFAADQNAADLHLQTGTVPRLRVGGLVREIDAPVLTDERVREYIRAISPRRIELDGGDAAVHRDAVVVHCAASGFRYPPLVPIWGDDAITIQPVRAGFPCLAAALIGYVEATRDDDKMRPEKQLFAFSIVYLFVLFGAVVVDRWLA